MLTKLSSNASFCSLARGTTTWLNTKASTTNNPDARKYGRNKRLNGMPPASMATISLFWARRLVNQMMVKNTMNPISSDAKWKHTLR